MQVNILENKKILVREDDDRETILAPTPNGTWLAVAKRCGLTLDALIEAVDAKRPKRPSRAQTPDVLRSRLVSESTSAATAHGDPSIEALRAAIETPRDEWAVIEWRRCDELAVLDVDFSRPRLAAADLSQRVRPRPAASWRSHGDGLHLIYHAACGYTAEELASAAAVSIVEACPVATVEVTHRTAHPGTIRERGGKRQDAGPVRWGQQDLEGLMACWRGGASAASDSDIRDWLDERGWEIGGRYPHRFCPFDPADSTSRDPVEVKTEGIRCFRCEAHGHVSRGFATWDRIIGGRELARIVVSAKHLVPWEHARYVVAGDYGERLPQGIARIAYATLVKLLHPNDPRTGRVLAPLGCVRGDGVWLEPGTLKLIAPAPKEARFAASPYCQWVDSSGAIQVDSVRVDQCRTNQQLPGYHPLVPIQGMRVWGQFRAYDDAGIRAVVTSGQPPRYLNEDERLPWDQCQAALASQFPGLNLALLELLVAARGFAENGVGEIPSLLLTGPSGAAKTRTVQLASVLLGGRMAMVEDNERFEENFGSAVAEGAEFLICDEYAKDLPERTTRRRFNRLLPVSREMRVRVLYVGWVTMRMRSVLIVSNISYGDAVLQNAQVGRRFVFAPLRSRVPVDWKDTAGPVETWRHRHPAVADSYVSHVIDRYFAPGSEYRWRDVASELGFAALEDSDEAAGEGLRVEQKVRELFDLLPTCPPAPARWRGNGWRVIDLRTFDDPATALWYELCDDSKTAEGRGSSTLIDELDLGAALELDLPVGRYVRLDRSRAGFTLALRFICPETRQKYLVNEQIQEAFGVDKGASSG